MLVKDEVGVKIRCPQLRLVTGMYANDEFSSEEEKDIIYVYIC